MRPLALQSFGFGDQLVRVTERNGAAWFVANDVCSALELANSRDAVNRLEEDEKGVVITDTLGGQQSVTIISESGVYTLIFRSRKPSAVAFRKWVTGEVLPALRREGRYAMAAAENDGAEGWQGIHSPDGMERAKIGLALVREARNVFGRAAAGRAWVLAGLPPVLPSHEGAGDGDGWDGTVPDDDRYRSINGWIVERVMVSPKGRVRSGVLFADYERWCSENEHEAETLPKFGKYLTRIGIRSHKSDYITRLGIQLRPVVIEG